MGYKKSAVTINISQSTLEDRIEKLKNGTAFEAASKGTCVKYNFQKQDCDDLNVCFHSNKNKWSGKKKEKINILKVLMMRKLIHCEENVSISARTDGKIKSISCKNSVHEGCIGWVDEDLDQFQCDSCLNFSKTGYAPHVIRFCLKRGWRKTILQNYFILFFVMSLFSQ